MNFNLALAQYPIHLYKSEAEWIKNLDKWFSEAKNAGANILCFPEYASMELVSLIPSHEKMNVKEQLVNLQQLHGKFLNTFIEMSIKYSVYVVAPSFPFLAGKKYYNRSYLLSPTGNYDFQDKIHMTRFEDDWGISPAETELKIFETSFGRLAIQICLDIEFPWASSLLAGSDVNLILVPSCTETLHGLNRVHIGARARALENQVYIGVSQVVGDSPWSLAVDINNGYAALYGPVDTTFPEDGIIESGNLNQFKWLVTKIETLKLKPIRENGQVFNFKLSSKYPWALASQGSLALKTIKLL